MPSVFFEPRLSPANDLRGKFTGWNVFDTLQNNDAYHALQAVEGLIITGATGTNVNDVAVVLIGGEAQAGA